MWLSEGRQAEVGAARQVGAAAAAGNGRGADGKAEEREVQTTRSVGNQWLVSGGLNAGDQIIISGLQYVQPGAPVQIAPASAPTSAPAK